jgi:hypothetical protein
METTPYVTRSDKVCVGCVGVWGCGGQAKAQLHRGGSRVQFDNVYVGYAFKYQVFWLSRKPKMNIDIMFIYRAVTVQC